eukprot:gene4658-5820_t
MEADLNNNNNTNNSINLAIIEKSLLLINTSLLNDDQKKRVKSILQQNIQFSCFIIDASSSAENLKTYLLDLIEKNKAKKPIYSGSCKPNWEIYAGTCLHGKIQFPIEFDEIPIVTCSMSGSNHWTILGTNTIYNLSKTGFEIYIKYEGGSTALTPTLANTYGWTINWFAQ